MEKHVNLKNRYVTWRRFLVLQGLGLSIAACLVLAQVRSQQPLSTHSEFHSVPGRVIDVDGTAYPLTSAGINRALQDACGAGAGGAVSLPAAVVSGLDATISVPSNCTLRGRDAHDSILQAKRGLGSPLILVDRQTNVVLRGFAADANRNNIDAIRISNSSSVQVSGVRGTNAVLGCGLTILYASNDISVEDSEFDRSGVSLPAADGGGIGVSPGALTMKRIRISRNRVHDNNQGISIFNSSDATKDMADVDVLQNTVYNNANDGIQALSQGSPDGGVLTVRIIENESYCNGWPENGVSFSPNCQVAFSLQSGPVTSYTGVGINVSGPLTKHCLVAKNKTHDNVYDGILNDARFTTEASQTVVETKGSTVSALSGRAFDMRWKARQPVLINRVAFLIASVDDPKSLTLTASAGSQTNAVFWGPLLAQNRFVANETYNNGVTTPKDGALGAGIYSQSGDGDIFVDNVAMRNNVGGLVCNACSFNSYNGDRAFDNYRDSAEGNAGFVSQASLGNSYVDVRADDPSDAPATSQTVGVFLDQNTSGSVILSPLLFTSPSVEGVVDNGTNNTILNLARRNFAPRRPR